jgi:hypothetical protein
MFQAIVIFTPPPPVNSLPVQALSTAVRQGLRPICLKTITHRLQSKEYMANTILHQGLINETPFAYNLFSAV